MASILFSGWLPIGWAPLSAVEGEKERSRMFPIADPILVFTLLIFLILLAPILADRLRIPDLVLLLLAGTILGPKGIHVLNRTSAITMFGQVGLLYIMFLAGLELDLHHVSRAKYRCITFGLLTFVIPQILGTLAGHYLLGFDWPASILLASMFASHTLLAYPTAVRLGISRSEPVLVTIGGTMIDNTLALLVLAIIAGMARGEPLGFDFWSRILVGTAVLLLLTVRGIPRLTQWFFENVTESGGAQFLFVLFILSACSYLSYFAHLEPIIGAFLAGAAFNRLISEHSILMNRLVFIGHTLFIPFFLISVGMLVDPSTFLGDSQSWLVAATMVITVILTKYIAAAITESLFHYDADSRHIIFGLSVVQAAATLAAVLIGYDLQIFDESVLNGSIAMIAVTCPLGAWMVDRYGRRLASRAPLPSRTLPTEQRILVPVAHPEFAKRLLDLSFLLRDPTSRGSIHPITIVRDDGAIEESVARGEKFLADCMSHTSALEVPVHPAVRIALNVSDGIVRAAKELRATLVLVGWGGERTVGARIFGTVIENLLDTCPSRILLCRMVRPMNGTRRILLPCFPLMERRSDFLPLLRNVKVLARQLGAELWGYGAANAPPDLYQTVETTSPSPPFTWVRCDPGQGIRTRFLQDITPSDLVFLPAYRRRDALWTPTIDKLPELLAQQFPTNNLLVAYPAISVESTESFAEETQSSFTLIPVDVGEETTIEKVMSKMIGAIFPPESPCFQEAYHQLLHSAYSYPIELSAGIVLLHAHCEMIEQPFLLVGKGKGEWALPQFAVRSHILLALLSPKEAAPDLHVTALADLARRFHQPRFIEKISQLSSAEAIVHLLQTPPETPPSGLPHA